MEFNLASLQCHGQSFMCHFKILAVCISQPKWMGFANLRWIEGFRWKEGEEGRGMHQLELHCVISHISHD